jgi:hypothetical protein
MIKADVNMSNQSILRPICYQLEAETVKELINQAIELAVRHEATFFDISDGESLGTLALGSWSVQDLPEVKIAGWNSGIS